MDDVRTKLSVDGAVPLPSSPEAYATVIDTEEKNWGSTVKSLNLKFE